LQKLIHSRSTDRAAFPTVDAAPGSDVLAFYSNYGAQVDVSAPGGDCGPLFPNDCDYRHLIVSTYIFPDGQSLGWAWFAGTSVNADLAVH
jgi:hypothetical protein